MAKKISSFEKRRARVRTQLKASATVPHRLSVYRSNTSLYAQVIDMTSGHVVASACSRDETFKKTQGSAAKRSVNVASSKEVGVLLAQRALEKNVSKVYFDRSGYQYHGRVKSLAEGAREGGLLF
ncbi:MAG: 50S ribosomal protein L18 [Alphaproteobacteria bacterium]